MVRLSDANARMSGRNPFNRSQRETCVTIGRVSRPMSSSTFAGASPPSASTRRASRVNGWFTVGPGAEITPPLLNASTAACSVSSRFLGLSGSMPG